MILPMSRVRVLGPRDRLADTLALLQDFGRVQLDLVPTSEGLTVTRDASVDRESRYLRRLIDDLNAIANELALPEPETVAPPLTRHEVAAAARRIRRLRHRLDRLHADQVRIEDERGLLKKYDAFLSSVRPLLTRLAQTDSLHVYGVVLPRAERSHVDRLAVDLRAALGVAVLVSSLPLASGDIAVVIGVPKSARPQMERALAGARIPEFPLPSGYTGQSLTEAAPGIMARLQQIPRELAAVETERREITSTSGDDVHRLRRGANDRRASIEAAQATAVTAHAFDIEGWVPTRDVSALRRRIADRFSGMVLVEEMAQQAWHSRPAPVVLSNPRLFRPFETLTALMPLPAYGTIDPTPFVAVGFPMLFGIILGDVAYGIALGVLALIVWRRSAASSLWRKIAAIALPCAAFAIIFGALYGEFLGGLGARWFGMRPLLIDREHAVIASMLVALGIGGAHIVLGLVLGIISSAHGHESRLALSRVVQLLMLFLIVLALLAAVRVLPSGLFTPFAIAAVIGFPVLLLLEGIVAPIEFFSTLSSVLSYVRIMALGTASVLLAAVANQMAGVFGSAIVGVLFALLFHLVNFALGIFTPTIHALRLHYVEFFRQFYSPGGQPYQPFSHWRPSQRPAP
jgi:V/A-type H+/Na+-transporting ATPase subunit I